MFSRVNNNILNRDSTGTFQSGDLRKLKTWKFKEIMKEFHLDTIELVHNVYDSKCGGHMLLKDDGFLYVLIPPYCFTMHTSEGIYPGSRLNVSVCNILNNHDVAQFVEQKILIDGSLVIKYSIDVNWTFFDNRNESHRKYIGEIFEIITKLHKADLIFSGDLEEFFFMVDRDEDKLIFCGQYKLIVTNDINPGAVTLEYKVVKYIPAIENKNGVSIVFDSTRKLRGKVIKRINLKRRIPEIDVSSAINDNNSTENSSLLTFDIEKHKLYFNENDDDLINNNVMLSRCYISLVLSIIKFVFSGENIMTTREITTNSCGEFCIIQDVLKKNNLHQIVCGRMIPMNLFKLDLKLDLYKMLEEVIDFINSFI